jgi:dihydroxyacetone kinase
MARGKASLGEKTLLDALIPATDTIEAAAGRGESAAEIARAAATTTREAAEATKLLEAKRGRASYTGERSIGSVDAGAMALAIISERIADNWPAG